MDCFGEFLHYWEISFFPEDLLPGTVLIPRVETVAFLQLLAL